MYFCKKYKEAGKIAEEDASLMAEYEELKNGVLDCLANWLAGHGCTAHEEIVNTLRSRQHAKALADRIDMCSLGNEDKRDFCFISSLSYLNFELSALLTEVFKVCMAVNEEITLCATDRVKIFQRDCTTAYKSDSVKRRAR